MQSRNQHCWGQSPGGWGEWGHQHWRHKLNEPSRRLRKRRGESEKWMEWWCKTVSRGRGRHWSQEKEGSKKWVIIYLKDGKSYKEFAHCLLRLGSEGFFPCLLLLFFPLLPPCFLLLLLLILLLNILCVNSLIWIFDAPIANFLDIWNISSW